MHGAFDRVQILDGKLIGHCGQDDIEEHKSGSERRAELMRDHRRVTFQVLRLALFLKNFPFQPHHFHVLGNFLEVDGRGWLLVVLDAFDADAGEFLFGYDAIGDVTRRLDHLVDLHVDTTFCLKQLLVLIIGLFDDLFQ